MATKTNVALAIAAASLFASTAFANTAHNSAKVKCYGVNACKGKSDCHTHKNACKGMNDCKGKGMSMMTDAECKQQGGSTHEKK